jgi:sodium/potassium-transporting ATPase subunit alpha
VRDGKEKIINAIELVPGDIVKINFGNNIPADMVIIRSNDIKVNNSSLTGESEEMQRVAGESMPNIFESPNVTFFGT